MRLLQGTMAALIMLWIVVAGLFLIPMAIQLIPADRPGICGRDCY